MREVIFRTVVAIEDRTGLRPFVILFVGSLLFLLLALSFLATALSLVVGMAFGHAFVLAIVIAAICAVVINPRIDR